MNRFDDNTSQAEADEVLKLALERCITDELAQAEQYCRTLPPEYCTAAEQRLRRGLDAQHKNLRRRQRRRYIQGAGILAMTAAAACFLLIAADRMLPIHSAKNNDAVENAKMDNPDMIDAAENEIYETGHSADSDLITAENNANVPDADNEASSYNTFPETETLLTASLCAADSASNAAMDQLCITLRNQFDTAVTITLSSGERYRIAAGESLTLSPTEADLQSGPSAQESSDTNNAAPESASTDAAAYLFRCTYILEGDTAEYQYQALLSLPEEPDT